MKNVLILFALFLVGLVPVHAATGDAFSVANDKMRVTGDGAVVTSSGVVSTVNLYGFHDVFMDVLATSTNTIKAQTSVATATLFNAPSAFLVLDGISNPSIPRGLNFVANWAGGSLVIVGTSSLGYPISETVTFSSGTPVQSRFCYMSISSFTITLTTVGVNDTSVIFGVGVSSRVALSNRVEATTDIGKVTENNGVRSTYTVTAGNVSAIDIPNLNGANDYSVWFWVKKSLLMP